ncbi:diaminopimelate decarboxylase [Natranaerobius thermophilus]|uniref:Diaminopimelate decarboxylase n=1 Tax=Natranaerobius thermophilus (strain ATCC BAA-1301 / DSM 18059 / JW/NM-WN-LF) TaxID=457570 RepID=B2A6F2_NATTJ|nr:diaminopimelate decarboxylase [Natranaerobius thermophilus]ACB85485.1 diaminopimelate decarboxylase [Natranaerobius thermophilus JW/NM-WN-LF]
MSESVIINEDGNLEIGGCDLVKLAQQYDTPLNILDEEHIRNKCRKYRRILEQYYPTTELAYAGKAFLSTTICKIVEEEGLFLDVVSEGELFTAVQAGFPGDKLLFHGNNKTSRELEYALDCNVGRIVVDSFLELELIEKLAQKKSTRVQIYFRVKPGIEAHTHKYILTGQEDSKFGFSLRQDDIMKAVNFAIKSSYIDLQGLHCHIGSQINESKPYRLAAKTMMELLISIQKIYNYSISELDLGGGMGIKYRSDDSKLDIDSLMNEISQLILDMAKDSKIELPKLIFEPGRSIIGEAGVMLYRVGVIKEIPGIRNYVSVDGGMSDNIRPALYGAEYSAVVANKANYPHNNSYTVVGKICESGDVLLQNIDLVDNLTPGDLLTVFSCGAYTYSMSSNYNRLPKPAVVLVNQGQADLIVRRESLEDVIQNDLIPERFRRN